MKRVFSVYTLYLCIYPILLYTISWANPFQETSCTKPENIINMEVNINKYFVEPTSPVMTASPSEVTFFCLLFLILKQTFKLKRIFCNFSWRFKPLNLVSLNMTRVILYFITLKIYLSIYQATCWNTWCPLTASPSRSRSSWPTCAPELRTQWAVRLVCAPGGRALVSFRKELNVYTF